MHNCKEVWNNFEIGFFVIKIRTLENFAQLSPPWLLFFFLADAVWKRGKGVQCTPRHTADQRNWAREEGHQFVKDLVSQFISQEIERRTIRGCTRRTLLDCADRQRSQTNPNKHRRSSTWTFCQEEVFEDALEELPVAPVVVGDLPRPRLGR